MCFDSSIIYKTPLFERFNIYIHKITYTLHEKVTTMLFPGMYERRQRRRLRRAKRRSKRKMYKVLHFDQLSNIEARNHLLSAASCYYEFPLLNYSSPPSNSYLDHCLVHAFQKAGFESTSQSGPRQLEYHKDSEGEIPFEGIIRGLEFGNKKNMPLLFALMSIFSLGFLGSLSSGIMLAMWEGDFIMIILFAIAGLFFIGFIVVFILFLVWRKKMPYTATILYWGLNCYDLPKVSDILGQQQGFAGEIKLDNLKSLLTYASRFHPRATILHVCIAFEMKPKRFGTKEAVMNKFSLLQSKVQEELGLQPINYEHRYQSQEIVAPTIFRWKKRKLRGLEDRFPLN